MGFRRGYECMGNNVVHTKCFTRGRQTSSFLLEIQKGEGEDVYEFMLVTIVRFQVN